jgi:transposase
MSPRQKYDHTFKKTAVELVKAGNSIRQVALDLGINENMLWRWKKEFDKGCFEPETLNLLEEVKTLRKKLNEAELEREILKKALTIFSKHPH